MRSRLDRLIILIAVFAMLSTAYVILTRPPVNSYLPSPDFINIQIDVVSAFFWSFYALRINPFFDIIFLAFQTLYDFLVILGFKKKRPFWGTVYDSVSKQPLDPVIVTLKDAQTGAVVEQAITDIYGRFGFLLRRGNFTLEAEKKGYRFPSTIITGNTDQIFSNLYHGGPISIMSPTDVVAPNIPMDQLEADFNQEAKKKIIRYYPRLNVLANEAVNLLFGGAVINSAYNYLYAPNPLNTILMMGYLVALIYKLWPKHKLWGRIINRSTQQPFRDLELELIYPQIGDVVVGRAMTNDDGKYFLKARPGKYVLRIKKNGAKSPFWVQSVLIGEEGLFDEVLEI